MRKSFYEIIDWQHISYYGQKKSSVLGGLIQITKLATVGSNSGSKKLLVEWFEDLVLHWAQDILEARKKRLNRAYKKEVIEYCTTSQDGTELYFDPIAFSASPHLHGDRVKEQAKTFSHWEFPPCES